MRRLKQIRFSSAECGGRVFLFEGTKKNLSWHPGVGVFLFAKMRIRAEVRGGGGSRSEQKKKIETRRAKPRNLQSPDKGGFRHWGKYGCVWLHYWSDSFRTDKKKTFPAGTLGIIKLNRLFFLLFLAKWRNVNKKLVRTYKHFWRTHLRGIIENKLKWRIQSNLSCGLSHRDSNVELDETISHNTVTHNEITHEHCKKDFFSNRDKNIFGYHIALLNCKISWLHFIILQERPKTQTFTIHLIKIQ